MTTADITTTFTLRVQWEDDWEVDHQKEFDIYEDGGPKTCERAAVFGPNGEVLSALCCIDDADDDYKEEIEKELIEDALRVLNTSS